MDYLVLDGERHLIEEMDRVDYEDGSILVHLWYKSEAEMDCD